MLASWRSMTKIAGSGSISQKAWIRGSGSGSTPKCHGSTTLWKTNFFFSNSDFYLYVSLHKGGSSYSRSLQPSKESFQHFKTWNVFTFSLFIGNFCPPGFGSGSSNSKPKSMTDLGRSGSATLVVWYISVSIAKFWRKSGFMSALSGLLICVWSWIR